MVSRHYKKGIDREQVTFLPSRVEDYVGLDNPVRAIDAYINSLDLSELGFNNSDNYSGVGQPAFSPSIHLKIYLWGYLNRVRSSRKLELECRRNLELIWLADSLHPGYHCISDFRKNNSKSISKVSRNFIVLCKSLDLFGGELVALDSAYLEGNASKNSVFTEGRLKSLLKSIDEDIERYNLEIDRADRLFPTVKIDKLAEKLTQLEEHKLRLEKAHQKLQESGKKQISFTDPDARHLTKSTGKGVVVATLFKM